MLHFQLLRYLVVVGSVATKDWAELAERFKLPNSIATNGAFLTIVKSLVATAEEQKALLVEAGMKEGLSDDLTRMVAELETAIEAVAPPAGTISAPARIPPHTAAGRRVGGCSGCRAGECCPTKPPLLLGRAFSAYFVSTD